MWRSMDFLALPLLAMMTMAEKQMPFLRMRDLPGISNPEAAEWVPIEGDPDTSFLPTDETLQRYLEESTSETWTGYNPYSVQPFVEGMGEYDEYQQAWRMLGFMIDCNRVSYANYGNNNNNHHSGDSTSADGCTRYILWAAYVDLNYEGAGIAEYQYYNTTKNSWDKSACSYSDGSRCAKMDCHESDTKFSLLGFFKHKSYDDWMEQLFKHEGICVWTDKEYAFMKNARKAWPQGCTSSGVEKDGISLYYDIKPKRGGRIAVALYKDSKCLSEYSDDTSVVEEIIGNFFFSNNGHSHDNGNGNGNYDFSSDSLKQSMDRWNSAFDTWTVCHPCVAYSLRNTDGSLYYNKYYGRQLGGESSPKGNRFECYDDAGYTNVNQCMKFSAKTVMQTATFRDMSLARAQNALASKPLSGFLNLDYHYRRELFANVFTYLFLALSTCCCCYSLVFLYQTKRDHRVAFSDIQGDLLADRGQMA